MAAPQRLKKFPIELLSDIGRRGFDLQQFSDAELFVAMKFMREVNGPLCDFLVKVLSMAQEPERAK